MDRIRTGADRFIVYAAPALDDVRHDVAGLRALLVEAEGFAADVRAALKDEEVRRG